MTLRTAVVPLLAALVAGVLVGGVHSAAAQTAEKGMVWSAPESTARAERDLRAMQALGVEAVRTTVIENDSLLALADRAGLALYLDLPVARLPAARLLDTLEYARAQADRVLSLAANHRSIRAIGLARHSDTSAPGGCRYFTELARHVRQSDADLTTYYVSRFAEEDACRDAVDLVLIDLRDAANPLALLQPPSVPDAQAPVGIAALGIRLRSDTLRGLRVPGSPERQARYLEDHLAALVEGPRAPPAVFVYRWRDVYRDVVQAWMDVEQPFLQQYGLHALDGSPRPALSVVEGIYTGRQYVFAFEAGDAPPPPPAWPTLLGWGVMGFLGVVYAFSPRFRHMVPRYFQARFFFREAVREGRDVLLGPSLTLLMAAGAASGLIAFEVLDSFRASGAFTLLVGWFPLPTQGMVATLMRRPLLLIMLIGCVQVFFVLVWTLVLSLLSRRKYVLAPSQVLMLVVWPRWPLLVVMIGAMVAASTTEPSAWLSAALAAAWIAIAFISLVQTIIDLLAVTRMPPWMALPALATHPLVLAASSLAIWVMGYLPELAFLWHAVTRQ